MLLISVALPVPLPRCFDYCVEPPLAAQIRRGCRVRVAFGARELVGVVVQAPFAAADDGAEYRPIIALLDDAPLLGEELLSLCEWAARYYLFPLGEILHHALPGRLRQGQMAQIQSAEAYAITAAGRVALTTLSDRARAQKALLTQLLAATQPRAALAATAATLKRARARGWIEAAAEPLPHAPDTAARPTPTAEQQAVLEQLAASHGFAVHLLEGVTGSGKTEIYLQRIEAVLAQGAQALVLVPEISLTPQLESRLRARLGDGVCAYHSTLTARAREQVWLRARAGRAQVIIGTRSALWLPFARLGVIVVDEEHDTSYKQQEGFRYSARDVAVVRAQKNNIPVLLGSATPSLETLNHARSGRYRHLRLRRRVHEVPPPKVQILDVRGLSLDHGLSAPLLEATAHHLQAGGQVLFFLNRRGYAPVLLCHTCGWRAACAHCDAHMTLHRGRNVLRCHHCGAQQAIPQTCPSCQTRTLLAIGTGTERVEQALANRFPQYRVARFDSDRITSQQALQDQLADIRSGRAQILVGTQILAKGHDFPNLSMVGIVSADQALYGSDFRAVERMGQLVTQVAGRAGRSGQPGAVWLQTHEPDHPYLQMLSEGGYRALSEALLDERRQTELPPFAYLALIRAEAREAQWPMQFLQAVQPLCQGAGVSVHDALPSGMERRAGFVRASLLLQARERRALHALLARAMPQISRLPLARKVRWSLDVDPYDLM